MNQINFVSVIFYNWYPPGNNAGTKRIVSGPVYICTQSSLYISNVYFVVLLPPEKLGGSKIIIRLNVNIADFVYLNILDEDIRVFLTRFC